ncbi:MAG: hypothetical protein DCC52_19600 [Chloroflexi bacterium]|nr:MAG: hypothetical protein DCC52_19600 [Chloroflexota bacterium]
MTYAQNNPAQLNALVQQLGDEYIDYLHENPEAVQDLIQGQSLGMAQVALEDVRERAATSDTVVELLARRLLRRAPREELPEPAPEVQALAERRPLIYLRNTRKRGDS